MSYPVARIILFTQDFAAMRDFYRDAIGLRVVEETDGWADLAAGGCNIAIHAAGRGVARGAGSQGPHKIAFYAADVTAARADLIARGVAMDAVQRFGSLHLCDGSDPDGNRIQLSNRA